MSSLDFPGRTMAASLFSAAVSMSAGVASPYQLNPFGLDPLRMLLAQEVDFEALRADPPVRLLLAATRVNDGRPRLFTENEVTIEMVLASTCLPLLQQAVEIDGTRYWDGGYSTNPPLRQLALEGEARDILLVKIMPEFLARTPSRRADIVQRARQIAFNSSLWQELESLRELQSLCREGGLRCAQRCRRLRDLQIHQVEAEQCVAGLQDEDPLNLDWRFLLRLKDHGRAAATTWLAKDMPKRAVSVA